MPMYDDIMVIDSYDGVEHQKTSNSRTREVSYSSQVIL